MQHPMLKFFKSSHLPANLKEISEPCEALAQWMDQHLLDNVEKSAGLRKLLEAKDCFVRAALP